MGMTGQEGYGDEGYTVVGREYYTALRSHRGLSRPLFFLVGCAVGAGVALLFTPQSGRKTRQQLQEASRDTKDKMGYYYERMRGLMGTTLDKGKEIIKERKPLLAAALEAGRTAYEREKAQKKAQRLGR